MAGLLAVGSSTHDGNRWGRALGHFIGSRSTAGLAASLVLLVFQLLVPPFPGNGAGGNPRSASDLTAVPVEGYSDFVLLAGLSSSRNLQHTEGPRRLL